MDIILIFSVIPLGLIALYFFVFRPLRGRGDDSERPDHAEPVELTGHEQHKRREPL